MLTLQDFAVRNGTAYIHTTLPSLLLFHQDDFALRMCSHGKLPTILCEFTSRNALLEESVDFGKGEVFRLWKAKVCPCYTEDGHSGPE